MTVFVILVVTNGCRVVLDVNEVKV